MLWGACALPPFGGQRAISGPPKAWKACAFRLAAARCAVSSLKAPRNNLAWDMLWGASERPPERPPSIRPATWGRSPRGDVSLPCGEMCQGPQGATRNVQYFTSSQHMRHQIPCAGAHFTLHLVRARAPPRGLGVPTWPCGLAAIGAPRAPRRLHIVHSHTTKIKEYEMAQNMHTYRPQSPHLFIHKPQFSSIRSVAHRATGSLLAIILTLGAAFPRFAICNTTYYPIYPLGCSLSTDFT